MLLFYLTETINMNTKVLNLDKLEYLQKEPKATEQDPYTNNIQ